MIKRRPIRKCRVVRLLEAELKPAVVLAMKDTRAIAQTMHRHSLSMAGEAIALMALETFFRRSRGIKPDETLLVCALDNVMKETDAHAFLPNRQNIQRLIPTAREIVANRSQPRPWTTTVPEVAASQAKASPAWS